MISRREFLWTGAAPLAGVFRGKPVTTRILLRLGGGPSHLDTWDPKPDAPSEIRGPYRAISTNVPGMRISEIFPRLAHHADKYALFRSVYHAGERDHVAGLALLPVEGKRVTSCSAALGLAERGEPLITVDLAGENSWDAHGWGPFPSLASYRDGPGGAFDRGCSSLLEDLHRRGMLTTTMVIATGEFGRSPRINPQGGRDHWPNCWTVMMAGGGIDGGQVHGSSDMWGEEPRDHPVSIQSLTAAISSC